MTKIKSSFPSLPWEQSDRLTHLSQAGKCGKSFSYLLDLGFQRSWGCKHCFQLLLQNTALTVDKRSHCCVRIIVTLVSRLLKPLYHFLLLPQRLWAECEGHSHQSKKLLKVRLQEKQHKLRGIRRSCDRSDHWTTMLIRDRECVYLSDLRARSSARSSSPSTRVSLRAFYQKRNQNQRFGFNAEYYEFVTFISTHQK